MLSTRCGYLLLLLLLLLLLFLLSLTFLLSVKRSVSIDDV